MTRTEVPVVRKQVVVNAPAEQAFKAFTEMVCARSGARGLTVSSW